MANEFKHKDPGTALTQAEFIASDGTGHIFDSQAAGDILYASSTTVLARLAKATDGNVLELASGLPAWTASPTIGSTSWANANHAHAASNSGGTLTTLGTVTTGVWQGTAIASGYIAADAITGAKIADDAIDSEHYTDGSIDNAHLADDAVDSDEIAAGAIDTAHIADNQVTVAKIEDIARGSIIYGNASAASAELTKGGANEVLTSDGTDIAWAAAGGLAAASQAEMESASSNTVAATPGRTQNHPGVAKVWCQITQNGSLASPDYGVASVTDTGTGDRTIVFTTDFSSIVYSPQGIVCGMSTTSHGVEYPAAAGFAVGSIQFDVINHEGDALADEVSSNAIFGDQ